MWAEASENGGTPVLDYRVSKDVAGTYVVVQSGIMIEQYTVTGLTAGVTYKFKVQARNTEGSSAYSAEVEILAAQAPSAPLTPTTTISGSNVIVNWSAPTNNGSPILGYLILIRQSDLTTFSADQTNCDGSQQAIIDATECSIPISTLRAGAYNLPWGASVYAKVQAYNLYGSSLASGTGNGAVILTNPDPPENLREDETKRSSNSITLLWDLAYNGGAAIIDFRISYDEGLGGAYVLLAEGVTSQTYTAITLTSGVTYQFKVEARNSHGYSTPSEVVAVLCATVPSTPATPYSYRDGPIINLAWVKPRSNGLEITSYRV